MSVQRLWFFVAGLPQAVHLPGRRTAICKNFVGHNIHGLKILESYANLKTKIEKCISWVAKGNMNDSLIMARIEEIKE